MNNKEVDSPTLLHPMFTMVFMFVTQISIGMLAFQKYVYRESEHDAWISVIVAGLCAHAVLFLILKTLKRYQYQDLFQIHVRIFGKWFGGACSLIIICYWFSVSVYILRNYIEVLHIWIFAEVPAGVFTALFFMLIMYALSGGLRVIGIVSLVNLMLVGWMAALLYLPIRQAEWKLQLLPIMEAGMGDIMMGSLAMGATLGGFEVVYYVSHRMKQPHRISTYAQLGLLFVNLLYVIVMLVSIGYYSEDQILNNSWGTLSLFKIVQFAFLERLEFVLIMLWLLIIVANLLVNYWIMTQGLHRVFNVKRKYACIVIMVMALICNMLLKTGDQLAVVSVLVGKLAVLFSFAYPIFIFIVAYIVDYVRTKGKEA
ncbi:GerAB/ArcD/ProY family transporter [Paenibacillus arenosi]|uniref:GerAB/ArcD/ProY family transporter n=1 Tax=Paenibacillus arenosi TaxID=2774142 RepID=A0ABR9B0E7_9BACL|nr:GerAB/ArcD/ProY family transporter [Paenibacillus arenosi]MBD8499369.1 GerAB/ArcD/ProY family transporter [Paenibacillus arenosi]